VPAKTPHPVDVHVGQRIRMRRIERKMSRLTLAQAIGLTFQQIQKYEVGTNRIGASRLQQICNLLKIPISFVFEGSPGLTFFENSPPQTFVDFMDSAEGARLVAAFCKIIDPELRRSIVRVVKRVADSIQPKASDDGVQLKEPTPMSPPTTRST
jgi:transcriptional regulator with XRE-family HTH domain